MKMRLTKCTLGALIGVAMQNPFQLFAENLDSASSQQSEVCVSSFGIVAPRRE